MHSHHINIILTRRENEVHRVLALKIIHSLAKFECRIALGMCSSKALF